MIVHPNYQSSIRVEIISDNYLAYIFCRVFLRKPLENIVHRNNNTAKEEVTESKRRRFRTEVEGCLG